MPSGEVVLVRCAFTRGGFPSELVFHIVAPDDGELLGVASREYCFSRERKPLRRELGREERVDGYVVGLLIKTDESAGTCRVNLPDNDVYEVSESLLVRNGELAGVSFQP
jgi:hypothetical protein